MDKPTRVVLVTGASSGFGRSIAQRLHERGYHVCGTSRLAHDKDAVPWRVLQMDVDNQASVESAVAQVIDMAGRIDAVVNNAGFGIAGAI
jgi:NAD(P)-dependent dehydrogenase (short-subunit alcohol dehydrogenase family)